MDAADAPPTDFAIKLSQGFGGENDALCALRLAESRGEFANTFHAAPPHATANQPARTVHDQTYVHPKTMERAMGHIGPVNGYFTQRNDDHSPQNEYDALADLFLSHDDARNLLSQAAHAVPQPTSNGSPRAHSSTANHVTPPFASSEGGPALRLHPTATPTPSDPIPLAPHTDQPAKSNNRVERIIVGNLPVLAGAWTAQYAKHVASTEHCTVALVRMIEGVTSIELIRPTGASRGSAPTSTNAQSLEDSIKAIKPDVGVWLFRIDGVPDTDWSATPLAKTTTLLTGADDAALVSSYRTLKSLASATTPPARPALRVAILGSDDSKSGTAEEKLRRGSLTFLGLSLDHVARIEKICPGNCTLVYQSAMNAHTPSELLSTLCRALEHAESDHKATAHQEAQEPKTANPARSLPVSNQLPTDNLSRNIAGVEPLPITCPYAPSVEIAIEAKSTGSIFHLLTADCISGPTQLLIVATWLRSHADLLRLAAPNMPAIQPDPILHVFTTDLRASRGLLDTPICVHFVVEVECSGTTKRVVTRVN